MTDMQMLQHLLTKAGEDYETSRWNNHREGNRWTVKANGLEYKFDEDGDIVEIKAPKTEEDGW